MTNKYDSPKLVGNGEFVIGLRPGILLALVNILLMEADSAIGHKFPGDVLDKRFLGIYNEFDSPVKEGFWTSEQAESAVLAIQEARVADQPTTIR